MRNVISALIAGLMATFSCSQICRYGCCAEKREYTFDELLDAIAMVESGGDPKAVGDNGEAVGLYQIHKIYVDDVNRICRQDHYPPFSYDNRWSPYRSPRIVRIYLLHYGKVSGVVKNYVITNEGIEAMARIHNGGPDGWKQDCTKKYWLKVEKALQAARAEMGKEKE